MQTSPIHVKVSGDDSFDLGGLLHLELKIFQYNLS